MRTTCVICLEEFTSYILDSSGNFALNRVTVHHIDRRYCQYAIGCFNNENIPFQYTGPRIAPNYSPFDLRK